MHFLRNLRLPLAALPAFALRSGSNLDLASPFQHTLDRGVAPAYLHRRSFVFAVRGCARTPSEYIPLLGWVPSRLRLPGPDVSEAASKRV